MAAHNCLGRGDKHVHSGSGRRIAHTISRGLKRRDAIAATADYTEDAVFLAAGSEPVRGRAALAAGLASLGNPAS